MNKKNKGFTLLEVLVSLAIIISITFAFFKIYNSSIRVNTKNDRDVKALNLAQSELENLRNQIKNLRSSDSNGKIEINVGGKILDIDNLPEVPIIYDKNYTDKENMKERIYDIKLVLSKSNVVKGLYLFNVDIDVSLKDKYFSKRKVNISTSILSNNVGNEYNKPEIPPDTPEYEPNFSDKAAFVRYQSQSFIFGYNVLNSQTGSVNFSNKVNKVKLFFDKKVNWNNKEYVDIYIKVNDNETELRPYSTYFEERNAYYYPCKAIRFNLNTWNGGNVSCTLENIKINGKLVKDRISLQENQNYDFKIDQPGNFELEFEVGDTNNPHFMIIFGQ